ncbi:unnamed protein product [Cyclocybe aegerita]|uniref:Carboxylic ester hydrolase n=1 Tax=Cyclocybe aegerita TaxID=1973307 RepID=A0A8S0VWA0_CYCAE|nr:unnamed protein product [Cyclocybe aegerita]
MITDLIVLFSLVSLVRGITSAPTVKLDSAIVYGTVNDSLTKFLGIPFAKPPARFTAAELVAPYRGTVDARKYGFLCPQQQVSPPETGIDEITAIINGTPELRVAPGVESEDCLTINIIRPAFTSVKGRLPVVVWIHGGAYQIGDTASYDEMGSKLVKRSISLRKPMIYVSTNFRLSAYGFLGGQEIFQEGNGNLGLRDQRLALKWVNRYINAFGGDKTKVTLWGQSSGSISTGLQIFSNGGDNEGLFRAVFMMSGSPLPIGNITKGNGQTGYDGLVADTGCSGSNDTLTCLRSLPFPVLKAAVDRTQNLFSYQSLALLWHPSVDGVFMENNTQTLLPQGKFANVPIVSGTCDDEGTLFGLSSLNITTEEQFRQYISSVWLPRIPASELEQLWSLYPSNSASGSPFDTGEKNALTPQFKRVSAFIGDSIQHGPRRFLLQEASKRTKVWSYLTKRAKNTTGIGAYHGSDLVLGVADDNLIHFVSDLDPNTGVGVYWPPYISESPRLYTFPEVGRPLITLDTYRASEINYLTNLSLAHPFVL